MKNEWSRQPGIDANDDSGLVAWLDCPAYRDPGERVEVSVFLAAECKRKVTVAVLKQSSGSEEWSLHGTRSVICPAGKSVEEMFDLEDAPPGVLDLALVVIEAEKELLRVEKRVTIGTGTRRGRSLAAEYRRKFPENEIFNGTLRELGRLIAIRDLAAGVNVEWRGLMLKTQFDLKRPEVRRRAQRILAAYRKWFPNYSEVLTGVAGTLGAPVEVCALAEQPLLEGPPKPGDGCLDVVFRGAKGNLLAFNKDRPGGHEGLVYSRYRISDGISFHTLAGFGANEAGFCTAGAALNASPNVDEEGVKSVSAWRASGGLIAPGGIFLLLLECKSIEDALRLIGNPDAPFANVANIMLADAEGRALVWQSDGLARVLREPQGEWKLHTCTNYPTGGWEQNLSESGSNSRGNGQFRERNLARLVEGLDGELGLERITRILRNHAEPGPICQHPDNNPSGYRTVMSYIMDPRNGDIIVAYGNPCEHKYYHYSLMEAE